MPDQPKVGLDQKHEKHQLAVNCDLTKKSHPKITFLAGCRPGCDRQTDRQTDGDPARRLPRPEPNILEPFFLFSYYTMSVNVQGGPIFLKHVSFALNRIRFLFLFL